MDRLADSARRMEGVVRVRIWMAVVTMVTILVLGHGNAAPLARVMLGYCAISPESMAFWMAEDQGFFRKYRLDASLIFLAGKAPLGQVMMAGDVPIGI